jgi:hypothetical protein
MSVDCTMRRYRLCVRLAQLRQSPPAQLVAAGQALEVSRGDQLQRVDLECRIGEQLLGRRFSSSSDRILATSLTSMPPNFDFQA